VLGSVAVRVARHVVVGNSGSGKSTLAARIARDAGAAHLDLDTLAWQPVTPPRRRPLAESTSELGAFMAGHEHWVIEGCYADLLAAALPRCSRLVFLNPGIESCVANARLRPWEPHKYPSRQAQDANLEMLIGWIRDYEVRADVFSLAAHRALFDRFAGDKLELTSREAIAAYRAPR
jgi:adenylate kinase family enzyme